MINSIEGTKLEQAKALISNDDALVLANLANLSSFIYHQFDRINWSGFYLWHPQRQQLVLGPFCGLPACTTINLGKGVCGTALQQQTTLVVDDVHQFAGHIACDSQSRSEIVIPLLLEGQPLGVLDIDSPFLARFTNEEKTFFEALATHLVTSSGLALQNFLLKL